MQKYTATSTNPSFGWANSLPGQLQSLQTAIVSLSKLVADSQSVTTQLLQAWQGLEARVTELEKNSASPNSIEQVRQEMRRFYTATRQKELILEAAMAENRNLRREVLSLEKTLHGSPRASAG